MRPDTFSFLALSLRNWVCMSHLESRPFTLAMVTVSDQDQAAVFSHAHAAPLLLPSLSPLPDPGTLRFLLAADWRTAQGQIPDGPLPPASTCDRGQTGVQLRHLQHPSPGVDTVASLRL